MSKHSTGPWRAAQNGNRVWVSGQYTEAGDDAETICTMTSWGIRHGEVSERNNLRMANARLIAAAPDLLAAAREAISVLRNLQELSRASDQLTILGPHPQHTRRAVEALEAAIAKATERGAE